MTTVTTRSFGTTKQGDATTLYTLENGQTCVDISNYGATVVGIKIPDQKGFSTDVVLGFDHVGGYQNHDCYFGGTIGRNCNRIHQGAMSLNKTKYQLEQNSGENNLHGGGDGFDKRMFTVSEMQNEHGRCLECRLSSPHMDQGFPGNLQVMVRYSLTETRALIIEYFAKSDQDTLVNLTNHIYFNLNGHASGSVLNHPFQLHADFYTPLAENFCPTGEIHLVKQTPYDFTAPETLAERIDDLPDREMTQGYDHNFVLRTTEQQMTRAAWVVGEQTGIGMAVHTNQPGLQLYSGNMIPSDLFGKDSAIYEKHTGFCLEPQNFPNSIQIPHFPSPILRAGALYNYTTVYQFSVV